jgi:hypothetical protein
MTEATFSGKPAATAPRRFGQQPHVPDPAGKFIVVRDPDVAKLMTPEFLTDGGIAPKEALRYTAFTAMMSFCYVTPGIACHIPMSWWLPDGLDAVRLKRYGEIQNVPVCSGAYAVIDRYLGEGRRRPPDCVCPIDARCGCGMMFTSVNGNPLWPINVCAAYERMGTAIGSALPLQDLLLRFCQRKLEETDEPDVARRFMGYRTVRGLPDTPLRHVPFDELSDFARRAGLWFAPYARGLGNEHRAAELLDGPSAVPAHCPGRRGRARAEPPRLPADHPLVAEISAIDIPQGDKELAKHQRWLRATYLERLEALVPGEMGVPQAAELLLIDPDRYRAHRYYHLGGGNKRKAEKSPRRVRLYRPRPRVRPDRTQAALLDRLRRFAWSDDPAVRSGQRREVAPECFVAIDEMVRALAIKMKTARRLLDLDETEWTLFRTAVAVGVPLDRVLPPGRYAPITPEWRRRVEEAHAARAPGEADAVVYFRLREAGFEGSPFTVNGICAELRRRPAVGDESELVALLREFAWPTGEAQAAAASERLLAAHLAEAAGLIAAGRAEVPALRALFRAKETRFAYLHSAIRTGLSVDQAMRPQDRRPLHVDDWRIADEVVRASSYGEEVRALYFRAVLAGFSGSEYQFRAGTARLQEARAKGKP